VNTFVGMVVDVERRRPVLANGSGGLSGPAIRPLAVWMTWQVRRAVKIPIVGMGGIMTGRDAVEFLLAGATAVQVGTANFVTPRAAIDVIDGIRAWLAERGIASAGELVGTLQPSKATSVPV
jgi:dihydroorotate dehydrogenase (NAD+) catalytic subunit